MDITNDCNAIGFYIVGVHSSENEGILTLFNADYRGSYGEAVVSCVLLM